MFTGINETVGEVYFIQDEGSNRRFTIASALSNDLKIDQSIAHNGVCLTVEKALDGQHEVVAIHETLQKSNLGALQKGSKVNIERCMLNNGRFDGHIVQGHVDQIGIVKSITETDGSWIYDFEYDPSIGNVTVEKGSITVNGISLTCFNSKENGFTVAIIPYTYEHTTFHQIKKGHTVNLEFDIIGKYVKRLLRI